MCIRDSPFIVATHTGTVSLLTNGIDLINKYDTWCFFICLFEQITDLGSSHADKHFHKFRTGNGEKRYFCLTSNSFSQQ